MRQSASDGSPGLHWTIGGGSTTLPSNLVGIASDDVMAVELEIDGVSVPVSLVNNAVFAEYPANAKYAVVTIARKDGSRSSIQVQLEQSSPAGEDLREFRVLRNRGEQDQP